MDVEALRAETPGCARRLHLNNAGAALLAQPTLDAMTAHLRLEAAIGGYEAAAVAQDAVGATYAGIAGLLPPSTLVKTAPPGRLAPPTAVLKAHLPVTYLSVDRPNTNTWLWPVTNWNWPLKSRLKTASPGSPSAAASR